jgi:hypothetical protein
MHICNKTKWGENGGLCKEENCKRLGTSYKWKQCKCWRCENPQWWSSTNPSYLGLGDFNMNGGAMGQNNLLQMEKNKNLVAFHKNLQIRLY